MPQINRQVVLTSRPVGIPQAEHFWIVESPVPEVAEGELLVRNEFLSVEPAMRGWVNAVGNYSDAVKIGEVMRAFSAGEVVASRHPGYAVGDRVMGMLGWQEYALSDGMGIRRKVLEHDLPLSLSLQLRSFNVINAISDGGHSQTRVYSDMPRVHWAADLSNAAAVGCPAIGYRGPPF